MQGIALCNKGIEDITALEVKEIISSNSQIFDGYLVFDIKELKDLCKLTYKCQSIRKMMLILDKFEYESHQEIAEKVGKADYSRWLTKEKSFKVDLEIDKESDNEELKGKIGESIINSIKEYKQKVNLNNPDIVIFFYGNNGNGYVCVDFSNEDLSKRSYRIFSHPASIKATLAYAMVRISDYDIKDTLLDPFCLSGGIPIEAALYANKLSVHFFDKDGFLFRKFMDFDFSDIDKKGTKDNGEIYCMDGQFKNVDSAKKNAKIAGINKGINFSRLDVEWLDTKFDKGSVDKIVTCLPGISKNIEEKKIKKLYAEFFYQAEFIVNKKGNIVVCTRSINEIVDAGKEKGFVKVHERRIFQGNEMFYVVKFIKEDLKT